MTYIILFTDLTMQPMAGKPNPKYHQEGARFFEADDTMTVQDVSECAAYSWDTDIFPSRLFDLIKELS